MEVMSKYYKLLFPFIFISCSIISFNELSVSSNITDNEGYFSENSIRITFSEEMNSTETEKIITLREGSSIIDVFFKWNNNICEIIPINKFNKNSHYSLQIFGKAVTQKGTHYDLKYEKYFIYGIKNDFFTLEKYTNPEIEASIQELKMYFSKPIDISSFESCFAISPAIKLKKQYSEDLMQITISPESQWPVNTSFTWSIEKLKSKDGYELKQKYTDSFFTYHDYLQPKLISSNLNNRKITDTINFTFNKKMNLKSFENNFSISPYIDGYFTQNDTNITYHPSSNFEIAKNYSIIISSKTCDEEQIPLYQDIKKTFKPINEFLKINSISINESKDLPLTENVISEINTSQTKTAFIEIIFSCPIQKQNLYSAEKAITLEPIFPFDISYPKLTEIKWSDDEKRLILTYSNIPEPKTIYKLSVNSSKNYFVTKDHEYMEKNICLYLITK